MLVCALLQYQAGPWTVAAALGKAGLCLIQLKGQGAYSLLVVVGRARTMLRTRNLRKSKSAEFAGTAQSTAVAPGGKLAAMVSAVARCRRSALLQRRSPTELVTIVSSHSSSAA